MQITLAVLPFVTPWLFAAGAAATSVPIVIHLLNRRKFRIHRWAAMEFLMAAMRRNARRLKFQRWLLLLLRCLAILLLAAAIAQFTFNSALLAHVLGGSGPCSIVVWDDAYPMGYRPPQHASNFERSRTLLTRWLKQIPDNQRVALIAASTMARSLAPMPTLDHALLLRITKQHKLSDAGVDLAGALQQAQVALASVTHRASWSRILVLTDCAAADFKNTGSHAGSTVNHQLADDVNRLRQAGAHIRIEDVGRPDQTNMAITNLQPSRPIILVNHRVSIRCTLFNTGPQPQLDIPLRFFLDNVPAGQETIARLDPDRKLHLTFTLTGNITAPGLHVISARLRSDSLPVDNTRRLVVNAVTHIRVLMVDGSPADPSVQKLASTAWLAAALSPDSKTSLFSPHVIGELELSATSLRHYHLVVLGDTVAPDSATTARLKSWVRAGGLLMIFPGPRTDGRHWNSTLGASPAGILPATIGLIQTRSQSAGINSLIPPISWNFDLSRSVNSITEPFITAARGGEHVGLSSVRTNKYLLLQPVSGVGSQVILQFTSGQPGLVIRHVGSGETILWASTADTRWTDFPAEPSWLPFLYELIFHTLPRHDRSENLVVGQKFDLASINYPTGTWFGPRQTTITPTMVTLSGRQRLISPPLRHAGLYGPISTRAPIVAVNLDPVDADIRHLPPTRVAAILGINPKDIIENPASLSRRSKTDLAQAGNVGHNLLLAALIALIAEALLARTFSRYGRVSEPRVSASEIRGSSA